MKLLARIVLVAAGCVHLGAVLVGRVASEMGMGTMLILGAEFVGAVVGLAVGGMVFGLGRRTRPPHLQAFSDSICITLAVLWAILAVASIVGLEAREIWLGSGVVWLITAIAVLAMYVRSNARADGFRWPDQ